MRNRIRTIRDAIKSVLMQKTDFKYNLIIIDNHSTDGTTEAIDEFKDDERVIHIIPERTDLGIGGCWNMGVHHPKCGKFAVQLDSDDVYKDENTLAIMVRAFYEQNCAMVVGTYMMTDFNMNMMLRASSTTRNGLRQTDATTPSASTAWVPHAPSIPRCCAK